MSKGGLHNLRILQPKITGRRSPARERRGRKFIEYPDSSVAPEGQTKGADIHCWDVFGFRQIVYEKLALKRV